MGIRHFAHYKPPYYLNILDKSLNMKFNLIKLFVRYDLTTSKEKEKEKKTQIFKSNVNKVLSRFVNCLVVFPH
jgi:hypothetical protein